MAMLELLELLIDKYGVFLLAGFIGVTIESIRNPKGIGTYLRQVFSSSFVAISIGVLLSNYTTATKEVVFIASCIGGMYPTVILNEIEEMIQNASEFFKKKLDVSKNDNE